MQQSRKPLDPGGDGALQLGVLRKEEEEDVGNDIFEQQLLECEILVLYGVEVVELLLKEFDCLGR